MKRTIIFLLFIFLLSACQSLPADNTLEALSLTTDIDSHAVIGTSDVVWNGNEYRIAYMNGDGPVIPEPGMAQHRISLATLDGAGNILEVKPLIENPQYSAQNPALFFTGIDYILIWVENDPSKYFKKLHAAVCDENGIIYDKIVSNYIGTWEHPFTHECGTYAAFWDETEEMLYIVYAEGNPRLGKGWPHPDKLIFTKLAKHNDRLEFVVMKDKFMLVKKKVLVPASTGTYNRISLVRAGDYLALAANASYAAPVPFLLLDNKGTILAKNSTVFGTNTDWPTLYWNGENLILGCIHYINNGAEYNVKKIVINDSNNGFDMVSVQKKVAVALSTTSNPVLLMKNNNDLSLLWKDALNGDKAIYLTGFDKDLNVIADTQAVKPPYNMVDLNDYYLIDGTGADTEFALVFTRKYINTMCNLLRFDFEE